MTVSSDTFFRSMYSGIILSIASIINMSVDNRTVGALLFSIGLTSIFVTGAFLYTGAVGNTIVEHKPRTIFFLMVVLSGNLAGCLISAAVLPALDLAQPILDAAAGSWQTKTSQSVLSAFVSSSFCGFLMYTAWKANSKGAKRPVISTFVIVLCVMVFVLAKFDHSIANAFVQFAAGAFDARSFGYLAVMVLGNTAGAVLPAWIMRDRGTAS